ncbi:hypothetical protein N0V88_002203 [Collariella sp. IMI 366227]|nr:hypothetical protein N0V88_002203 [Collariella sp. IMI 366227]
MASRSFHFSSIKPSGKPDQPQSTHTPSDGLYSAVEIDPKKKTVTTAVGNLPISPLMDPSFHEARQRFQKPKPKPAKSKYPTTKFQRKLARNPYGPSAYVLSRQRLFQELQAPNSPFSKQNRKLLRMSDHGSGGLTAIINDAKWRTDMDDVLLRLMRRRAIEGLAHFARMSEGGEREYVIRLEKWSEAEIWNHRGCLLWLGPEGGQGKGGPPRLSTTHVGEEGKWGTLAVHNLPVILGSENVERFRRESKLLREGSLFLLGRLGSIQLQMLLWKLQGYMLWDEKSVGHDEPSEETPETKRARI